MNDFLSMKRERVGNGVGCGFGPATVRLMTLVVPVVESGEWRKTSAVCQARPPPQGLNGGSG